MPIRLKWSKQNGFLVVSKKHDLPPFHIKASNLADVDAFDRVASEYNWPRQDATTWRAQVTQALIDLRPHPDESADAALVVMDLLDAMITVEEALERLELLR